MSTKQDYINALNLLVGGQLPLGEAEKIFAIDAAIKKYSSHRPLEVAEDVPGNGTEDYALSSLASWSEGFSAVKKVDFPVDTELLDADWEIIRKPAGRYLRLSKTPAATETLRVFYTCLHTCTDDACTVAAYNEEALQMLAAAYFCEMLAAYYAQTQDSTIAADAVDHKSKASEYQGRARAYRLNYYNHLGSKEGEKTAASVTKNQDVDGSFGDKLTHPKRFR